MPARFSWLCLCRIKDICVTVEGEEDKKIKNKKKKKKILCDAGGRQLLFKFQVLVLYFIQQWNAMNTENNNVCYNSQPWPSNVREPFNVWTQYTVMKSIKKSSWISIVKGKWERKQKQTKKSLHQLHKHMFATVPIYCIHRGIIFPIIREG